MNINTIIIYKYYVPSEISSRVVKQYIGVKKYCNIYCNIANKYIDIGKFLDIAIYIYWEELPIILQYIGFDTNN
jgi:hypothetical protein